MLPRRRSFHLIKGSWFADFVPKPIELSRAANSKLLHQFLCGFGRFFLRRQSLPKQPEKSEKPQQANRAANV
jgi:hypothetical protein